MKVDNDGNLKPTPRERVSKRRTKERQRVKKKLVENLLGSQTQRRMCVFMVVRCCFEFVCFPVCWWSPCTATETPN